MSFSHEPLQQIFKYVSPSPTICSCHYCTSCVLSDLWSISMRTVEVVLSGCVDGSHHLVNDHFQNLCLATCRCLQDITDRHRLSCIAVALLSLVGCMSFSLKDKLEPLQHDHGHVVKDWIANWNSDIGTLMNLGVLGYWHEGQ